MPGKLSGPYTELSGVFEIVPNTRSGSGPIDGTLERVKFHKPLIQKQLAIWFIPSMGPLPQIDLVDKGYQLRNTYGIWSGKNRVSNILVRHETPADAAAIAELIQHAYESVPFSNHREHLMVSRLRASPAYVPELSLVAEVAGQVVGHLLLTRIAIRNGATSATSLALAPLSVRPEFQGQGVGSALVNESHQRARKLGFQSIVVVGIEGYYSRFGYVPLDQYAIKDPR